MGCTEPHKCFDTCVLAWIIVPVQDLRFDPFWGQFGAADLKQTLFSAALWQGNDPVASAQH